jgi:hypothetical protein
MCVLIFSTNSVRNISRSNKNSDKILLTKILRSSCKTPVIRFSRNLCLKNIQISNFMKTRPVGAELFHGEGETDGQI